MRSGPSGRLQGRSRSQRVSAGCIGLRWGCGCRAPRPHAAGEMSLMLAIPTANFSKIDFKKTGFAAAGPEPSASEVRGTERSCVRPSQRVAHLETPGCLRPQEC
jgi:hypothetical protein